MQDVRCERPSAEVRLRCGRCGNVGAPMTIGPTSRIAVAGAGSIGCYLGGCRALAGRPVTLLLRPSLADAIAWRGLQISSLRTDDTVVPATALTLAADPVIGLAQAEIVLVTVKSGATADMAKL